MKLTRLLTRSAAGAALVAAALALAPAASAAGPTSSRTTALPAAGHVVPTPAAKKVTIVVTGDRYSPSYATLDWTLPACTGTVYAYFQLDQEQPSGTETYLQEKGTTAYPCKATPQTLHVRYHGVDPSAHALTAGTVHLTTRTYSPGAGGQVLSTSGYVLPGVLGKPALPDASSVSLTPAAKQVAITVTGDRYSPSYATLDWTLPACTGTVYAYFQLDQEQPSGTETYLQEKGTTAYPCKATPQTLHVRYHGVDPSAHALTAGNVDLTTTTYVGTTNRPATASYATLPGVLTSRG